VKNDEKKLRHKTVAFLFHSKFRQFPVKQNPPGDAHAAQRKAAALPCGGAQSPVRSPQD